MNYTQITQTALAFADRTDTETTSNIDNFLRMIEAKIDRVLRTQQMEVADALVILANTNSATLPVDFAEMREFALINAYVPYPMQYVTPRVYLNIVDTAANFKNIVPGAEGIYTILSNDTIGVWPINNTEDRTFAFLYYKKVAPLLASAPDNINWISEQYPDVYISGLVYEISCFVKNPEAATLWNERFNAALNELTAQNWLRKWPGASLVMTLGD